MTQATVCYGPKKHQPFSADTLRGSILRAAAANKVPAGQAKEIADKAVQSVERWLEGRSTVTPQDIRRVTAGAIEPLHPNLAFFFAHGDRII
jgi:hypothetical protein